MLARAGCRISDHARLEQRVEIGAADADTPTDLQRGELAVVDPLRTVCWFSFRSEAISATVMKSSGSGTRSRYPLVFGTGMIADPKHPTAALRVCPAAREDRSRFALRLLGSRRETNNRGHGAPCPS